MPQRTLTEREFNSIRDRLLAEAPDGLDEQNFQRWIAPRMAAAIGEAENLAPKAEGSAAGRFVSNAAAMLNPVALAEGVAGALRHPIDTAIDIGKAQFEQGRQAVGLAREGRFVEAAGHAGAAALPIIGPAAAEAGAQIASGDIAGGLGSSAGLLAPMGAPSAIRAARRSVVAATPQGVKAAAAGALERGANARVESVMSPTVGPNKIRFGNQAAAIAPQVAKTLAEEGAPLTREGLHVQMRAKLMEAGQSLDAAADARLASQQVRTAAIVRQLDEQIAKLTATPVEASKVPVRTGPKQVPGEGTVMARQPEAYGKAVEPAPNSGEIETLRQIRKEIADLGPIAPYDSVRKIRQAWDQVAKVKYLASTSADALKAQGNAIAAVKGTGAIREGLGLADPATAAVNAEYSMAKAANDVLDAVAEVERVRPKVGRQIMARLTGVLGGQHAGGIPGAIAGYVLAPAADSAMSSGMTTRLKTARLMTRLATAVRKGDVGTVTTVTSQLKRLGAQGATLQGRTTSPSGFPMQPEPSSGPRQ